MIVSNSWPSSQHGWLRPHSGVSRRPKQQPYFTISRHASPCDGFLFVPRNSPELWLPMGHLSFPRKGASQLSARRGIRDCAPDLRIATGVHLVAMRRTDEETCAFFRIPAKPTASGFFGADFCGIPNFQRSTLNLKTRQRFIASELNVGCLLANPFGVEPIRLALRAGC